MTKQRIEPGFVAVAALDRDLAGVLEAHGSPPSRKRPQGFETLLRIIVEQQLSLASAAAIWQRLSDGLRRHGGKVSPTAMLLSSEQALRGHGLSRAKVRYCRALATAVEGGDLNFRQLAAMSDEAAIENLTAIKGIGRWTAEVYLLAALARADVWPAQDVALMSAAQELKNLPERPGAKEMIALAEPWRPWRAYAARLLWLHYRHTKMRQTPV